MARHGPGHPAGVGGPTRTSGRRAVTETPASLGGVLKRGAALSAVGLVIAQAATIVQTLVIGRLLGPHEVGVFVAGSVMIGSLDPGRARLPVAGPHQVQDRGRGRRQHSTGR